MSRSCSIDSEQAKLTNQSRHFPHSEAAEAKRKIVKSDNFTGQTNTVDVDKHM